MPKTDVNNPAACFIFSKVTFVPNTLEALMSCNESHSLKLSLGNFKFKVTFALFNNKIFCRSKPY